MTIKHYSLKTDGEKALSTNFKVKEFACKDGCDEIIADEKLITVLQQMRTHFGKPIIITSGYRTAAHNAAVGGSPKSQHLYGKAADIQITGIAPEKAAQYAETLLGGAGGIGLYPKNSTRAKGWVHIDTRASKARWKG